MVREERTRTSKETKSGSQLVAELKVANANLENQVANLRREVDDARQEARRAAQSSAHDNANLN